MCAITTWDMTIASDSVSYAGYRHSFKIILLEGYLVQTSWPVAEQNQQQTMSTSDNDPNHLAVTALSIGDAPPTTLSVSGGECVVIAGPSGSGKSRLLRALADLDPGPGDRAGVIQLGGIDHLSYSGTEWRRRVAYLAAESQWWFDDVAGHFPITPTAEDLKTLGLTPELMRQPVRRLSTGERQRLALLRLLAGNPRVLLLDEPTAALDPRSTRAVEQMVSDYRSRNRTAVLWVSHDIDQARRLGDRYLYFDNGHLLEMDTSTLSGDGEMV